jgi:hypothetical protein
MPYVMMNEKKSVLKNFDIYAMDIYEIEVVYVYDEDVEDYLNDIYQNN